VRCCGCRCGRTRLVWQCTRSGLYRAGPFLRFGVPEHNAHLMHIRRAHQIESQILTVSRELMHIKCEEELAMGISKEKIPPQLPIGSLSHCFSRGGFFKYLVHNIYLRLKGWSQGIKYTDRKEIQTRLAACFKTTSESWHLRLAVLTRGPEYLRKEVRYPLP